MKKDQIREILSIFEETNPNPNTELIYHNAYTLLIAVVLSAQATDKGVNIATKELFKKYDSPEKVLELGLDGLKQYTKTLNYYPTKSKNIIALSQILVDKYNSQTPDNLDDLVSLPGVGRKTANVILGVAFGHATMPVDTHVMRVSERLGLANAKNPDEMERKLIKLVDDKWLYKLHHWLVLHGRYICKAKKPLCDECMLAEHCKYYKKISKQDGNK